MTAENGGDYTSARSANGDNEANKAPEREPQ
jgi:hypothetical protein